MQNTAVASVHFIKHKRDDPQLIVQTLEWLQYNFWTRNKAFMALFIKSGGVAAVINLLRPPPTSSTKNKSDIKLYHSVHGTAILHDIYDAVIFGCAAELLSRIVSVQPSLVDPLVDQDPWLIPTMQQYLQQDISVALYGALVCLESLMSASRQVRQCHVDDEMVLRQVCHILKQCNSQK